jgi:alpha-N-arabinofuranosidase
VVFDGSSDLNYYFATRTIPAKPNTTYRLTGWVKTDTLTTSNGGCFQIGDARGWPATHSCSITPSVIGTADWTKVQVDYQTLPDTHAITLTARRLEGAGPVSGRASYRDLSLHEFTPHRYGAVPWLGVDASRSVDRAGKTHTYLIIVNRRLDGPVSTSITVRGMQPRQARAWILSGPTIDATNEKDPETVSVHSHDLGPIQNGFTLDLPPASMTAVAID